MQGREENSCLYLSTQIFLYKRVDLKSMKLFRQWVERF